MKKSLCYLLALVCLSASFFGCGKQEPQAILTLKPIDASFDPRTNVQRCYADDTWESWGGYADKSRQDKPEGLHVSWEYEGETKPTRYLVEYTAEDNFDNSMWQDVAKNGTKLLNLELGATYHIRVTAYDGRTVLAVSSVQDVTTPEGTVRFLDIDGVSNVRDMGAWSTEDGKQLRQGLIYRGGKLEAPDTGTLITRGGLEQMQLLGVQTEIDLRSSDASDKSTIPDADIAVISIKGSADAAVSEMAYRNNGQMKQLFDILSRETSYPLYIHCAGGIDRTGYVCYVLESLLGVGKEDAMRDYLLSNFAIASGKWRLPEYIEPDYVAAIEKCDGSTWKEKAESYVLSLGVTMGQIDAFRNIMLK